MSNFSKTLMSFAVGKVLEAVRFSFEAEGKLEDRERQVAVASFGSGREWMFFLSDEERFLFIAMLEEGVLTSEDLKEAGIPSERFKLAA